AEDGIRDFHVTGVQTCALPISSVVKTMAGRPVTIRTLDIGSDKTLDGEITVATNPALGQRAIRYCLARPELFATQLRALLRAAEIGRASCRERDGVRAVGAAGV